MLFLTFWYSAGTSLWGPGSQQGHLMVHKSSLLQPRWVGFFSRRVRFGLWGAWGLLEGWPRRLRAANSALRWGAPPSPKSVAQETEPRVGRTPPRCAPGRVGQTSRGLVVGVTRKTASRLVQRRVKARCSAKVLSSRSGAPRGRRAHAVAFTSGVDALLPHTSPQTAPRSAGNR